MVPSRAERNESLYKQNDTWYDLQTVNTSANFCIKALIRKRKFSQQEPLPLKTALLGVYPNPVYENAVVDIQLSIAAAVMVNIYDLNGKFIETLVDQEYPAGYHWKKYDVSSLPNGIYLCTFKINGQLRDTKKILVIK